MRNFMKPGPTDREMSESDLSMTRASNNNRRHARRVRPSNSLKPRLRSRGSFSAWLVGRNDVLCSTATRRKRFSNRNYNTLRGPERVIREHGRALCLFRHSLDSASLGGACGLPAVPETNGLGELVDGPSPESTFRV